MALVAVWSGQEGARLEAGRPSRKRGLNSGSENGLERGGPIQVTVQKQN